MSLNGMLADRMAYVSCSTEILALALAFGVLDVDVVLMTVLEDVDTGVIERSAADDVVVVFSGGDAVVHWLDWPCCDVFDAAELPGLTNDGLVRSIMQWMGIVLRAANKQNRIPISGGV